MAKLGQILTAKLESLRLEGERIITAAEAADRLPTAEESARLDAIEVERDHARAEQARFNRRQDELLKADAEPDTRIEAVHDRGLDKPWGYQWRQAGATAT